MNENVMPKGGIQQLRDFVIGEMGITDPEFNGYGNMIENAITVLHRTGKIQWKPPGESRTIVLDESQLRALADQLEAYQMLDRAGAGFEDDVTLSVHGTRLATMMWTNDGSAWVRISSSDNSLAWTSDSSLRQLYPPREIGEDDE